MGVPIESFPNECRVAITPQNTALLLKKGFARVLVERGAGTEAQFPDDAYAQAGATIVDRGAAFSESDIVLKVRPPSFGEGDLKGEAGLFKEGSTLLSFLYPAQNKALVDVLAARKVTSFAMDMVPRISRAQVFDALRLALIITFNVPSSKARFS